MNLNSGAEGTLAYNDGRQVKSKRDSSWPSPEDGRRLVQPFRRVERRDLREEVLNFVEEILRRHERD
jgi:hypothetical protein